MTLADARKWAQAARSDATQARTLASKLVTCDDEQDARMLAQELEQTARSLHRSTLFCLAALPNGSTKEGATC